jgi:hypothetical protein
MALIPPHGTLPRAREMERAEVVADASVLRGIVRMGPQVRYCDDKNRRPPEGPG